MSAASRHACLAAGRHRDGDGAEQHRVEPDHQANRAGEADNAGQRDAPPTRFLPIEEEEYEEEG